MCALATTARRWIATRTSTPSTPIPRPSIAATGAAWRIYLDRLRLILALRRERFDYAILAAPGSRRVPWPWPGCRRAANASWASSRCRDKAARSTRPCPSPPPACTRSRTCSAWPATSASKARPPVLVVRRSPRRLARTRPRGCRATRPPGRPAHQRPQAQPALARRTLRRAGARTAAHGVSVSPSSGPRRQAQSPRAAPRRRNSCKPCPACRLQHAPPKSWRN